MFEGYQQCVISSTSSHAKKNYSWGGVAKRSSVVLSVRKQRDLLSIIPVTSAHWQAHTYIIWCPVILLLYMCKSFTLCQKRSFDDKTSPHQRGHGETESHRKQSIVLPARARPATDSDKDDNSSVMVWRLPSSYTVQGKQCSSPPPPAPRSPTVSVLKFTKQHEGLPTLSFLSLFLYVLPFRLDSVAYHRLGNDSRWKR